MTKRVGIWIRVSTDKQEDSAENHEKRATLYAESKNWEIAEKYVLIDVSGKTLMAHPEMHRMLNDIERGHIEGLIFSKLARLARNTRELLDFADFFREKDASLISLGESIDTSSPAGRLFYTMLSAIAQWEREEIVDRVSNSIAIRAKMGKPLGGKPPYGYSQVNGRLTINEEEAPIRKLMFELFLKHKRRSTVAKIINERGYRTRAGKKFSDVVIKRHLTDTVAKGLRRVNFSTWSKDGKTIETKPREAWEYHTVPAVVSEEMWNEVNDIIKEQERNKKQPLNRRTNLFSGFLHCHNGHKMLKQSSSKKYSCVKCKVRIDKDDIEKVFQTRLKAFVFSDEEIEAYLAVPNNEVQEKQDELETTQKKIWEIENSINKLFDLHSSGEIPTKGFNMQYNPLFEQLEQLQETVPVLERELLAMQDSKKSIDEVIERAKDLYGGWKILSHFEKREVVEAITNTIVFDGQNLTFKLKNITPPQSAYSFSKMSTNGRTNHLGY